MDTGSFSKRNFDFPVRESAKWSNIHGEESDKELLRDVILHIPPKVHGGFNGRVVFKLYNYEGEEPYEVKVAEVLNQEVLPF